MQVEVSNFGEIQAKPVSLITIKNSNNMQISVTNYGCIVTSLIAPDKNGKLDDLVLGYDKLEKYLAGHPFFGAVAGRYANRIEDGKFSLDGIDYQLETNEVPTGSHLHGGSNGFDKAVWDFSIEEQEKAIFIHLNRVSVNGESGYPANLNIIHTIGLDEDNQVHFDFKATTDKPTILNLVNHSYYNLAGHKSGSIENHQLQIFSDFYTPITENCIPTGEILSVKNTCFDFTNLTQISENMAKAEAQTIDYNFILNQKDKFDNYNYCAKLVEINSGRMMEVFTTQPAVQFYNGVKLSNKTWIGKDEFKYEKFGGLCLETQHYPNSPNNAHFPTTRLNSNEVFIEKTIHRFSIV